MGAAAIDWTYAAFAAATVLLFVFVEARRAALTCYLGGWLVLPVGHYPPERLFAHFPIDVVGLAIPARMLVAKASVVPAVTCLVALAFDRRRWLALRPCPLDVAIVAFCAWPLAAAALNGATQSGIEQAAYLTCAWGGSWLLGRVYGGDRAGSEALIVALALAGLPLLPVALVEAVRGPFLYPLVYGVQPYLLDGASRYVGYRPFALFEHGNQYGIWMAMAALAGVAVARQRPGWWQVAGVLAVASVVSQSAGAVLLLAAGALALLPEYPLRLPRWLVPVAGAGLALVAGVFLSGVVPIDRLVRDTAPGQMVLAAFRRVDRGSLPWRISQELKVLPLILQHPIVGSGRWDWWLPAKARPWDVPFLILGQYGIAGLLLALLALFTGPLRILLTRVRRHDATRIALAVIVVAAGIDAGLNSFIYFPAILAAGALAVRARPVRASAFDLAESPAAG